MYFTVCTLRLSFKTCFPFIEYLLGTPTSLLAVWQVPEESMTSHDATAAEPCSVAKEDRPYPSLAALL